MTTDGQKQTVETMKSYITIAALLCSIFATAAQSRETVLTARQLASLANGNSREVVAFERHVIKAFRELQESKAICPPQGRSVKANNIAAVEAAKTGVEEGLFDVDSSAIEPLSETFSFWFPCRR